MMGCLPAGWAALPFAHCPSGLSYLSDPLLVPCPHPSCSGIFSSLCLACPAQPLLANSPSFRSLHQCPLSSLPRCLSVSFSAFSPSWHRLSSFTSSLAIITSGYCLVWCLTSPTGPQVLQGQDWAGGASQTQQPAQCLAYKEQ